MPKLNLGTFQLHYEESGVSGEPIVLVHGAWGDRRQWDGLVPRLSESCRVLSYDRRGHGGSSSPGGSVALADQVADLSTLLSVAGRGARHLVGNGIGGVIALQLALQRPDQVRSVHVHEPTLLGLVSSDARTAGVYEGARERARAVAGRLSAGDPKGAAQLYAEGASSEAGGWEELPPVVQASFVANAMASLKELSDPTTQTIDVAPFAQYREPVVLTSGGHSAAVFAAIDERLAESFFRAMRYTYAGAGHFPHVTQPDEAVRVITEFCRYAAGRAT
jgi:pimeloyl-ACP methyl ester carboxylesterase